MASEYDVPVRGRGVKGAEAENTLVLINIAGRHVYRLNETGARAWALADGKRGMHEIARLVALEFDVSECEAKRDLQGLFSELEKEGLIHFLAAK